MVRFHPASLPVVTQLAECGTVVPKRIQRKVPEVTCAIQVDRTNPVHSIFNTLHEETLKIDKHLP